MILRTPRLYLRPMRRDDSAAIFAILGDPGAMRFWDRTAVTTPEIAAEIIAGQMEAMQDGNFLYWTVCLSETGSAGEGQAIGSCDLSEIDRHHGHAQVGLLFRREHWGRGYGREALAALADHGFGALGLARLWARIHAGNEAAKRVLEACGFAYEGRLRAHVMRDGARRDCEIYARLRVEGTLQSRL